MKFPFAAILACLALAPGLRAQESVTFNKTKFVLAYAPDTSPVGIREYLPEGETLEHWKQMLSSRIFAGITSPEAYAKQLADSIATKGGPNARSQILRDDKTGALVVDFLVFSPEGSGPRFAEWNLMRVDKAIGGVRVIQYARRFYDINGQTAKTIKSELAKILPQLAKLQLPE